MEIVSERFSPSTVGMTAVYQHLAAEIDEGAIPAALLPELVRLLHERVTHVLGAQASVPR